MCHSSRSEKNSVWVWLRREKKTSTLSHSNGSNLWETTNRKGKHVKQCGTFTHTDIMQNVCWTTTLFGQDYKWFCVQMKHCMICWDCLYLGACSPPPWQENHNTANGYIFWKAYVISKLWLSYILHLCSINVLLYFLLYPFFPQETHVFA